MQWYLPETGSVTSPWNVRQMSLDERLQTASHKAAMVMGGAPGTWY
jgi:hypothetical protein